MACDLNSYYIVWSRVYNACNTDSFLIKFFFYIWARIWEKSPEGILEIIT